MVQKPKIGLKKLKIIKSVEQVHNFLDSHETLVVKVEKKNSKNSIEFRLRVSENQNV